MTTRHRRPSAYQPRPATLPPGTHFRGARVVSPTDEGSEGEDPMLTGEVPVRPPAEQAGGTPDQIAVVAEPHDAEGPPPQLDGGRSRRTRLSVLALVAVVVVATSAAYQGWRLVGEDGREAASDPTPTSTPPPTPLPSSSPASSPASSPSLSATVPLSGDVPPVKPPDGGSYLEVTVLDSGDLDVDQWVRSSTPLTAFEAVGPCRPARRRPGRRLGPPSLRGRHAGGHSQESGELSGCHLTHRRLPGAPDLPALGRRAAVAVAV